MLIALAALLLPLGAYLAGVAFWLPRLEIWPDRLRYISQIGVRQTIDLADLGRARLRNFRIHGVNQHHLLFHTRKREQALEAASNQSATPSLLTADAAVLMMGLISETRGPTSEEIVDAIEDTRSEYSPVEMTEEEIAEIAKKHETGELSGLSALVMAMLALPILIVVAIIVLNAPRN